MEDNTPKWSTDKKVIVGLIAAGLSFYFVANYTTLLNAQPQPSVESSEQFIQNIENQVAIDAVAQYEIAKRQGDKIQIYVQAGLVAAAYLQAKDEANYKHWKDIEAQAAKDAGIHK